MRFFVFPQFMNIDLLDVLQERYPNIQLPYHTDFEVPKNSSEESLEIFKTNGKLFFEASEEKEVDDVLEYLQELGFDVVSRHPSSTRKLRCKCGVKKCPNGRAVVTYMNDRVILKYQPIEHRLDALSLDDKQF
jgi:hypothetical protein